MELLHIDHFTLSVAPEALPALLDFYTQVLPLNEGARPAFAFPGHWLYAEGRAIVHLAGTGQTGGAEAGFGPATGKLDHVSLRTRGLARTRQHLAAHGILWKEAPVPGMALHQLFLRDPAGLKIELTFDAAELEDTL